MEKAERVHAHMRSPSEPTFLSRAMRSDYPEALLLPFRVSVHQSQDTTQRNLPYLRLSWTRTDVVAVMSFWITFALAIISAKRGHYHTGIFRTLGVL